MILSHLSTRDLTRALTVSKHWHNVILDPKSRDLRRILFLEPAEATEYLDVRNYFYPRHYKGKRDGYPAIVHEPSDGSKLIVEVHPVLLPHCGRYNTTRIYMRHVHLGDLRSVPPSTYLSQPPLEQINLNSSTGTLSTVQAAGGVTFGALLEDLATRVPDFRISSVGAVSMVVEDIEIARTAQAMDQLCAKKETMRPEVFRYNRSRIWQGRPAVHEAEYERLKILGIVGPTTTQAQQKLDGLLDSELRLSWNETVGLPAV